MIGPWRTDLCIQSSWSSVSEVSEISPGQELYKDATGTFKGPYRNTYQQLEGILHQASEVFKEGIGTLTYSKARIMINENVQAMFHTGWPAPYNLNDKVDVEWDLL